jgi:hypothetical protein
MVGAATASENSAANAKAIFFISNLQFKRRMNLRLMMMFRRLAHNFLNAYSETSFPQGLCARHLKFG